MYVNVQLMNNEQERFSLLLTTTAYYVKEKLP